MHETHIYRDLLTFAVECFFTLEKSAHTGVLSTLQAGRRAHAADHCPHVRKLLTSGNRHQAVGSHVLPSIGVEQACFASSASSAGYSTCHVLECKLRYVRTKTAHPRVLVRSVVCVWHKRRSLYFGLFEGLRTVG